MLDKELHIMAYDSICAASKIERIQGTRRAAKQGVDRPIRSAPLRPAQETLEAFTRTNILPTISKLKDHTFQFQGDVAGGLLHHPQLSLVKDRVRSRGPQTAAEQHGKDILKGGPQRLPDMASLQDRVVLKVMALILEAIYDAPFVASPRASQQSPKFLDSSHGFRRGRNPHTALKQLSKVKGIEWVIVGEIYGLCKNAYYKKLEELLCRYIDDQQFIDLFWKAVRVGHINMPSGKFHFGEGRPGLSQVGDPQQLSPILSNIFLHEFDKFMQESIEAAEQQQYAGAAPNNSSALPARPAQITYIRYADTFIIAGRGSSDPHQIKVNVKLFLERTLNLELNGPALADHSLPLGGLAGPYIIKDGGRTRPEDRAYFLGAEICGGAPEGRGGFHKKAPLPLNWTNCKRRGGAIAPGKIILLAPIQKLVKKLEELNICSCGSARVNIAHSQRKQVGGAAPIPTRKTA